MTSRRSWKPRSTHRRESAHDRPRRPLGSPRSPGSGPRWRRPSREPPGSPPDRSSRRRVRRSRRCGRPCGRENASPSGQASPRRARPATRRRPGSRRRRRRTQQRTRPRRSRRCDPMCDDRRPQHLVVQGKRRPHRVRVLLPGRGRPLDVREQERHCPRRGLSHRRPVSRARRSRATSGSREDELGQLHAVVGGDHLRGFLTDHDAGRVGVAAHHVGHHARVGDA